jgi:hypothetical protein
MLARVLAFHLWLPNNHAMHAWYISESESICSVSLASMHMNLNLAFYKSITLLLISWVNLVHAIYSSFLHRTELRTSARMSCRYLSGGILCFLYSPFKLITMPANFIVPPINIWCTIVHVLSVYTCSFFSGVWWPIFSRKRRPTKTKDTGKDIQGAKHVYPVNPDNKPYHPWRYIN